MRRPKLTPVTLPTALIRRSVMVALMAYAPPPQTPTTPMRSASTYGSVTKWSMTWLTSETRKEGSSIERGLPPLAPWKPAS
ncbi:hypothetical protein YW5DRAFT_01720 [Streptomyces sp. Ncost-T6T-1]|nr:hypothetical protein YW5DRAFT_01720 [Streptomyces sp. Ncost-T6T-1]